MSKTYARKVGLNRGKPRLWLEGKILLENGFGHKVAWDVTRPDSTPHPEWPSLYLIAEPSGKRLVAGSPDRPVIDINSKELLAGFTPGEEVMVRVIGEGHLHITRKVEG